MIRANDASLSPIQALILLTRLLDEGAEFKRLERGAVIVRTRTSRPYFPGAPVRFVQGPATEDSFGPIFDLAVGGLILSTMTCLRADAAAEEAIDRCEIAILLPHGGKRLYEIGTRALCWQILGVRDSAYINKICAVDAKERFALLEEMLKAKLEGKDPLAVVDLLLEVAAA